MICFKFGGAFECKGWGGICLIEKKMNCVVRFFETMRKKVRYKKSLKNKKEGEIS